MKAVMYHYVREFNSEYPYFKSLHIDDFKRQLDFFEANFGFVSLQEFLVALHSGQNPDGVILTFDDGLKDHFDYVFPVLKERGLWGIFYVPTMMYETKEFLDVHKIHLLLGKFSGKKVHQTLLNTLDESYLTHQHIREFREVTYSDQINDDHSLLVKRTLNYFIDTKWRSYVLNVLMKHFFPHEREIFESFYLSQADMLQMQAGGMVIGSHTVTHPVMSKLSVEAQEKEIADSFHFLETTVGDLGVKTFCYPYGGFHAFTSQTEKLLHQNGCSFSFNVETRDIAVSDLLERQQALPRYDCNFFPFGQCREVESEKELRCQEAG
jgi:peptidoglycan/xylan/chitin deacetylase (PgdA/CDA1 family)